MAFQINVYMLKKKLSFPEAHFKHVLNFQFCQKYTLSTKTVYLKYTSCKGQFGKGSRELTCNTIELKVR